MKEAITDLIPTGTTSYKSGGKTFGQAMTFIREKRGLSSSEVAEKIGISECFLLDLESDKRYPPAGVLYKTIYKVYGEGDENAQIMLDNIAGMARLDIEPDTIEFLRRNWYARHIVNLMMQVDVQPFGCGGEELLCASVRDTIYKIAQLKGIKIEVSDKELDFDD